MQLDGRVGHADGEVRAGLGPFDGADVERVVVLPEKLDVASDGVPEVEARPEADGELRTRSPAHTLAPAHGLAPDEAVHAGRRMQWSRARSNHDNGFEG